MGLLERIAEVRSVTGQGEARAIGGLPWRPWDDPYWRFDVGGPVHPSRQVGGVAGVDAALRLSPLYACVRFLADGVAQLPVEQYRVAGDGSKTQMPLGQLLEKPSAFINRYDWLYQYVSSAALHGTAWGLKTARDAYGNATTIEWLPAEDIVVIDPKPYNPAKARVYFEGRLLNMDDLFIVRAFTIPGRTAGISPMKYFQMQIEAGIDALEYGRGWFRSGGFPTGTFQNTQYEVTDEQTAQVRRKLVDAQKHHLPLVYGRDWDYKPVSVPPDQAQFIQTIQMNATQIATVYGVQPRRVGGMNDGSQTYANVEMDMLSEVVDSLDPWLCRLETALEDELPGMQVARFDRDARLRMTTEARFGVYQTARDIGVMNVDEIRQREHMKPLPKPVDEGDYDGEDWTPLQIQVASARGANVLLGQGEAGFTVGAAKGAQQGQQQEEPQQAELPGMTVAPAPAPVPAGNGNGNGSSHR